MQAELPSRKTLAELPITTLLCVVALLGHLYWHVLNRDVAMLMLPPFPPTTWAQIAYEPWRLLAPAFLHVNMLHLVLNLLWLWLFGGFIERMWGGRVMLGLCLLTAIVANLSEALAGHNGVGLSGVVYGLMGWWSIQTRRDPRLYLLQQPSFERLFLGWLVIGVVITWLGWINIGNLAHLTGLLAGVILALLAPRRWLVRAPRLLEPPVREVVDVTVFPPESSEVEASAQEIAPLRDKVDL